MKKKDYYSADELSTMLGINKKTVRNKLSKAGLKKQKTNGARVGLYSNEQVNKLRKLNKMPDLSYEELIEKNYNVQPIIITYYIYESKMNNPNIEL